MTPTPVEASNNHSESDTLFASSGWLSATEMPVAQASEEPAIPSPSSFEFLANRRYLMVVLTIVIALVALKVGLAIMATINEIPLTAPIFELIGMGATGWFLSRYLLLSSKRTELLDILNGWKQDILG